MAGSTAATCAVSAVFSLASITSRAGRRVHDKAVDRVCCHYLNRGAVVDGCYECTAAGLFKRVQHYAGKTSMLAPISGYHKDEVGDWVAELACGHFQHVRHNPPWTSRPWVITSQGRHDRLGHELDCKKCDRGEPADQLIG